MSGIRIESLNKDERPTFVLNNIEGVEFRFLKLPQASGVTNFALNDVRDFSVFRSKPVADGELASASKQNW